MNARFYQDLDTMFEWEPYEEGFSFWGALWEFAEAMWLAGHEDEESDG